LRLLDGRLGILLRGTLSGCNGQPAERGRYQCNPEQLLSSCHQTILNAQRERQPLQAKAEPPCRH
jgi:hypothetical protein